ncbi:MAG: antitoxin Xre/MbcA/ParS toxin-binding domain-containing protein [Bacteroidota bacterium]
MLPAFTLYSPFVYLTKNLANETYDLFLIVPIEAGTTLELVKIEESPLSNIINYNIIKIDAGEDEEAVIDIDGKKFFKTRFHFDHNNNSQEINHSEFEVIVSITYENSFETKNVIHYEDADILPIEEESQIAINRPYVYLVQPHQLEDSDEQIFYPRMLIPTKSYKYSEKADDLLITSGRSAVCENLVALYGNENTDNDDLTIIFPSKVNKASFRDTARIHGNFSAIVLLFDSFLDAFSFVARSDSHKNLILANKESSDDKTKSETKARTGSADTMPVSGIPVDDNKYQTISNAITFRVLEDHTNDYSLQGKSEKKQLDIAVVEYPRILGKYEKAIENSYSLNLRSNQGVSAEIIYDIVKLSNLKEQFLAKNIFNFSTKTLRRYRDAHKILNPKDGEIALKLVALYKKGIEIFGEPSSFNSWIRKPAFGLGNVIPLNLMNTSTGVDLIMEELIRIEYGDLA